MKSPFSEGQIENWAMGGRKKKEEVVQRKRRDGGKN